MKGNAAIFIILGIVVTGIFGFLVYLNYFKPQTKQLSTPSPSPQYQTFSEDPKYKEVKEKYNLSEEQLQILSTVNPDDND